MTTREWTDPEINALCEREGFEPLEDIARDLGRSLRACESKLARVKGKSRKKFEREQVATSVRHETSRAA